MTKDMCFQTIFDMGIIVKFIVLGEGWKIVSDEDDEFVPLLVYERFDKDEIFADLVA